MLVVDSLGFSLCLLYTLEDFYVCSFRKTKLILMRMVLPLCESDDDISEFNRLVNNSADLAEMLG